MVSTSFLAVKKIIIFSCFMGADSTVGTEKKIEYFRLRKGSNRQSPSAYESFTESKA